MFAVQNGGWCAASAIASFTYDMYGVSSACKPNGKGGPWANQVYVIKGKCSSHCCIGQFKGDPRVHPSIHKAEWARILMIFLKFVKMH